VASKFTIEISAVDKASAVVNKINEKMAKVTRPFEDTRKSFKRFETAVAENPIAKGLGHVSGAALGVARSIGKIAAPIAAVTGVGSIAGIAMLADRWAKFGRNVLYTSQTLGISTTKLQQYEGMATLAGVSTDGMVSSVGALGTTMEDARWGRNQGALMLLNRLGIGLKKTKDGAWDVNAEMMAVSKVMTSDKLKNNPWAQSLIASQLGMTALLPMLRQGEQGMRKYEEMQKRLGYSSSPQDIQNADQFAQSLSGLQMSAEGLGQSLMDKAMPALNPFVDELSNWIAKNRELYTTDVASWIKTIADYIKKVDWKSMGDGITGFFTNAEGSATGLKTALDDVVATFQKISDIKNNLQYGLQNGGALEQALGVGGQFTTADNAMYASQHSDAAFQARQQQMMREGSLLTLEAFKQSAGWLEKIKPDAAIQTDYQDYRNNYTAKSFLDPSGYTPRGLRNNNPGNLNYVGQAGAVKESGPDGRFAVFKAPTEGIAALAHQIQLYGYRGNDTLAGIVNKFAPGADGNDVAAYIKSLSGSTGFGANQHLNLNDPTVVQPLVEGIIKHENGSNPYNKAMESSAVSAGLSNKGPYSSGAATVQDSTVHVQVDLKNAPRGTTAKATTTGNAQTSPPRIGYSAVGAAAA